MDDVIKFGKGDLLVSVTMNSMVIRQIENNKEIGDSYELKDIVPTRLFQINLLSRQ